jgi:hypothetical protein
LIKGVFLQFVGAASGPFIPLSLEWERVRARGYIFVFNFLFRKGRVEWIWYFY